MLEGLEAVEILFSDVLIENDFTRIDSEYQKKEYVSTYSILKSIKSSPLDTYIDFLTDGKHGGVELVENGVVFLRTTNIKENRIDLSDLRYISKNESEETKRAEFTEGDLLLTTIGTVGVCVKVPKGFPRATINQNLVRIVPNNKDLSSYLCCFLNSKFGKNQTLRYAAGNVYQMINYPNLRKVLIPCFTSLTSQINNLYSISEDLCKKSRQSYTQAETLLLDTLGLQDFEPSSEPVNVKSFSESFLASGRLDAEYYQRKYEEIENALKKNSNGFTFVKNEFGIIKDIIDKTEKTYNYTEISDVNTSDGTVSYNEIEVTELPDNGKLKLKKGQLIISKVRPYRGAVAIIREEPKNYVGSGAFTVLEEKGNIKKEVLQVLLRTKPYQELIMKYNVGSSYPVVKDEDILNLPIPNIDKEIQQQIAEKIEESFRLKRESERLLELAKRAVEVAIEEGEEAGVELMKNENNSKNL